MSKLSKAPVAVVAETPERPKRRRFSAAYKAKILAECDAVTEPGGIGAILRREGLYSSHLVEWRRRRAEGGLEPRKTGRPPKPPGMKDLEKQVARLERENVRLQEKLRKSEIIVQSQKKLAEVLSALPTGEPSGRTG